MLNPEAETPVPKQVEYAGCSGFHQRIMSKWDLLRRGLTSRRTASTEFPFNNALSAVSEWLQSEHKVHMIRDHPGHKHHNLMGGLWCAKRGAIPDLRSLLDLHSKEDHFNADQEFLRDVIWPVVKDSVLQHVNFGCEIWKDTRPIPAPRVGLEHVGAVYVDDFLRSEDAEQLQEAILNDQECH
jgi:hypothetical protein